MRITILGSTSRQSNTAKVLSWIEEQFRADNHEVQSANILDYDVQGCREDIGNDVKARAVEFARMAAKDR
jgi:NAD(P)H-dependent FMN reductase